MTRRILLVLSLALALAADAAAAGLKAVVQDVHQPAQVSSDGVKYKKIKTGTALFTGDVLRTGETGRLVIRFVDGTQAAVAANTDVALRRLTPREDPVKTTLSLLRGSLRALVKKLSARSSFEVETYNTVVAVKGTDFEVGVATDKDGHKKTVATCFETQGKGLEVSGLDRSDPVHVGAGESSLNRGERPEAASILRATDLQKALEKYRALNLTAIPVTPPGVEGSAPASPATAEEKKAQETFDAAARKSEAALSTYLEAVDKGDLDAQAKAQSELEGLREAAQGLEDKLTDQEDAIQKQLDGIKSQGPAGDAAQQQVLQAQLDDIKQLQQTMKDVALQSQLEAQADAAQGNLFMDRDGFRVQINSQVIRPPYDGSLIQKVTFSKRSAGPNTGTTEFQHIVKFNKDINGDWVDIYERSLNDPVNLSNGGGSPDYFRSKDIQKTFSPGGDCVCLEQDLTAPVPIGGGLFAQGRQEFFQAIGNTGGIAQGQRTYDYLGVLQPGSDIILVSSTDLGNGLRLSYDVTGNYLGPTAYLGNIFTVDINLPGGASAMNAASLGNSFYSLATADLSGLGGGTAFQLTFTSPAYPGRQVSPLLDKNGFVDAFREGWR